MQKENLNVSPLLSSPLSLSLFLPKEIIKNSPCKTSHYLHYHQITYSFTRKEKSSFSLIKKENGYYYMKK